MESSAANPVHQDTAARLQRLMRMPLFFIVGMPRSGTTWLQRMLNRHEQICCKGEAHFVDMLFSNLQKAFHDYNRTVRKQGGAIAHLAEYGGRVDSLAYDGEDQQLLLAQAIYLMFDKWAGERPVSILGEKTSDHILSINLLSRIFPGARFIHLVRDGRDAAVSAWFFNRSGADSGNGGSESFDNYVQKSLKQWRSGVQYAQAIGESLNERYLEVRFESLLEDGHAILGETLRFLGADASPGVVARCVDAETFEVLTQGRRRGSEDPASFHRKGIIGDWRNHLDDAAAESAWQITGDKLALLGYPRL